MRSVRVHALAVAGWVLAVPYVLATCLTPTLSSHLWIRVFGVGNFIAMGLAAFIESRDYSSIWCTLAAFLSLMIVAHFYRERQLRAAGVGVGPQLATG